MPALLIALVVALLAPAQCFNRAGGLGTRISKGTSSLRASMDLVHHMGSLDLSLLQKVSAEQAKGEFYFFFFAGSGALGIGASQIPKIAKQFEEIREIEPQGPSLGGEELSYGGFSGLLYKKALSKADVEQLIEAVPDSATLASCAREGRCVLCQ
jgi:hypothetical protein